MEIEKYKYEQTEEYSVEVSTTLKELQQDLKPISADIVKNWVINGDKSHKIIKSGKIKLFKKQE